MEIAIANKTTIEACHFGSLSPARSAAPLLLVDSHLGVSRDISGVVGTGWSSYSRGGGALVPPRNISGLLTNASVLAAVQVGSPKLKKLAFVAFNISMEDTWNLSSYGRTFEDGEKPVLTTFKTMPLGEMN